MWGQNSGTMAPSPKSEVKKRKQHIVLRDPKHGYVCQVCGNSGQRPEEITGKPCFPLPHDVFDLAKPSPDPGLLNELVTLQALEQEEKQLANLLDMQKLKEEEELANKQRLARLAKGQQLLELEKLQAQLRDMEALEQEQLAEAIRLSSVEAEERDAAQKGELVAKEAFEKPRREVCLGTLA